MIKSILTLAIVLLGFNAQASNQTIVTEVLKAQNLFDSQSLRPLMLDWTVGDNAQYKMDIGGFIQGTMEMRVRETTPRGFWLVQDMDLGFAGKQLIEIHLDQNTGEIIEMRVNGQKQAPPDAGNQEIVDSKEDRVTVPAGTFDCVYLKIRDTSNSQESEAWLNPSVVPMMGLIKNAAQSQFGPVDVQLTGYEKK